MRGPLTSRASEAAQILDTTEESVTSALKRARAALQRTMAPAHDRERPPAAGSAPRPSSGLLVLTLSGDRISGIAHFRASVIPRFGLPATLPQD